MMSCLTSLTPVKASARVLTLVVTGAALVATVAGLAVAIPALFGYNYLGSLIKNTSADMHIFVDEYISRITETYSR